MELWKVTRIYHLVDGAIQLTPGKMSSLIPSFTIDSDVLLIKKEAITVIIFIFLCVTGKGYVKLDGY